MPSNYECTVCGTSYDFGGATCSICERSGHIIYTGAKDKAAQAARDKARQKRATNSKPKSETDWSWGAAILAFILGLGFAGSEWDLEGPAQFIVGGIGAAVAGLYYKQILGLVLIALVIFVIAKSNDNGTSQRSTPDVEYYYITCIINGLNSDVKYKYRWESSAEWTSNSIEPGGSYSHGSKLEEKLYVNYDNSYADGYQEMEYWLDNYYTSQQCVAAKRYEFFYDGNKIDMKYVN